MNLLRRRRHWTKIFELINSECVKHLETVVDVALGGDNHVLPAGLGVESAVDKRTPPRGAINDEIKDLTVGSRAFIGELAKDGNA